MSKVVLITGGSSGIGKAIGEFLFHKGYTVYGTSRNPEKITNSVFPLIVLDVCSSESIQQAVANVISSSGRIDIVINNAGVGITGPIEETATAEMRNNFETNFFGPIEVIKAVLPQMREQKSGLIINITSIAGYMGLPYRGIYSASKGALEIVSEAISIEVKSFGINIVNIAPGEFATDIASHRYHAPILENSVYKTPYENTLGIMNSNLHRGDNPEDLALVIYQIINDKNPKLHYKVGGFMQKISIVLKRILPDRIYESMLMNHYKL
ncbi:SDR family oxidoreductase [Flavobacterium sp.]|uniref:SDR family oxidoreductase n=1 Tax=Flavobacterium sp. TaxID=239 RepID=UPI0025EA1540|nr:SDR family oxidoreductase [Flavobacterium sp.]